ncbi:hypothetical protein [Empedobacter sedimenti]|uniref:hypothetical protein n=1 Tax=Empedobacter sedimenti TaxID=3042610 RepID=UPI0024A6FC38|nr:hypothetical protein [Empedobacter sedimenti]
MKEKIVSYSLKFIKDIIPVIAGILIALFIDNWNSSRKDKMYIDQVFITINNELKDTKTAIDENIPKQEALIDAFEKESDNPNMKVMNVVMNSKGIFMPQIKLNAWKSVSNTKIDLIEYKKINALSNIEDLKTILNNKVDFLMSFLYNNINATDRNTKQTFKMILQDILQTEITLQKYIDSYQKSLR